jgi:hypothetical protein
LTAVFILLTIGFAQEVEGVQTSWPYLTSTFLYYITSEKIVCDDVIEHLPVTISQNMFVLSSEKLDSFKKEAKVFKFLKRISFSEHSQNIEQMDGIILLRLFGISRPRNVVKNFLDVSCLKFWLWFWL